MTDNTLLKARLADMGSDPFSLIKSEITFANGTSIESEFQNSLAIGKSKITNPI